MKFLKIMRLVLPISFLTVFPLASQTAYGASDAPDGAQIYRQHCASCHGSQGQGTRMAPSLRAATDLQMVTRIVHSGAGIMPSFAQLLTDPQIKSVSQYVAEKLAGG